MKKTITTAQISSLDEFGNRIGLNPAEVKGKFRTYRTIFQTILVIIFLGIPWTEIKNHQTLYFNISDREFYFFGLLLKAHNAPLLLFLLLGGALTLAFVTSVWGRVWCGWACPQTVFIDGLYRRIEFLIEGNYLARRKMKVDELSLKYVLKKTLKWVLFYFASAVLSHSFLAYFVGAHRFIDIVKNGPSANLTLFYISQALTLFLVFNFGWFREQFCTIMCPYGRIQGLLIDNSSLAVIYDEKRNDCVQCNRCVNACPVGIDIRNGLQMECIACTACIDACDEIMEKVNKPKGLIKYDTINSEKISLLKPRSLLYLLGISICVIGLIYSLSRIRHSEAFILRSKSVTFTEQQENGVDLLTNQFRLQIHNQSDKPHIYKFEILGRESVKVTSQLSEITVKPSENFDWHFFVTLPKTEFKQSNKLQIQIYDAEDKTSFHKTFEVTILGPSL